MPDLCVLTTGTRHATPADWQSAVHGVLALHLSRVGDGRMRVVHGAARGIDSIADDWVRERQGRWPVSAERYPADWTTHGSAAGPIRNAQMRDRVLELQRVGFEVVVCAFSDDITQNNGKTGTAGMCRLASAAGLPVTVYGRDGKGRAFGGGR